ncbi:MAG: hypothetical protein IT330_12400 [Anaerolineae bacterium]|nr:hypothetical protein [Anaerolineae bacterium]
MQTLWRYPVSIFIGLGPALLVFFAYLFPDGRFVPRWTRWPAIICGSLLPLGFVASSISPTMPVKYFYLVLVPLLLGNSPFAVYAQFYRYSRVSNTVQRQQTKWVLLGLLASALGMLALIFPLLIYPAVLEPGRAHVLYILFSAPVTILSLGVIPLSISLSILRYRLWDIDIIIRRTLVYSLLTALLALVYFSSIVLLQNLFAAFSGQRSELTIVASTLAIAALFTPLRRRVQDGIDRRFYRRKYDAAKTLATFSATVRDETNLDNLTGELLAVVQETMQPEHVSLWLRKEEVKRKA